MVLARYDGARANCKMGASGGVDDRAANDAGHWRARTRESTYDDRVWRPPRSVFAAAGLVALDGIVIGQGALSFLCGVVLSLGFAIGALVTKDGTTRRNRIRDAVVYIFIFPATLAIVRGNAHLAQSRGDALVAACDAFRARNGRYPDRLDDLVPTFVDRVPRASFRVLQGEFKYWRVADEDDAMLVYWIVPPFMHRSYSFKNRRWVTLD